MLTIIKQHCFNTLGNPIRKTTDKELKKIQKEIYKKEGKEYSIEEIVEVWKYMINK